MRYRFGQSRFEDNLLLCIGFGEPFLRHCLHLLIQIPLEKILCMVLYIKRMYTDRHPVIRKVLKIIIWGVPLVCLGSR